MRCRRSAVWKSRREDHSRYEVWGSGRSKRDRTELHRPMSGHEGSGGRRALPGRPSARDDRDRLRPAGLSPALPRFRGHNHLTQTSRTQTSTAHFRTSRASHGSSTRHLRKRPSKQPRARSGSSATTPTDISAGLDRPATVWVPRSANVPASQTVTSQDVLNGLYVAAGTTLGGLSPTPITFTQGKTHVATVLLRGADQEQEVGGITTAGNPSASLRRTTRPPLVPAADRRPPNSGASIPEGMHADPERAGDAVKSTETFDEATDR